MSPPGVTATTERPGVHITGVRVTDLTSQTSRERYLVAELGVTYPQAKALIRAYEVEVSHAARIGNDSGRSDADFLDWLLRQAPGGRRRATQKREWRGLS